MERIEVRMRCLEVAGKQTGTPQETEARAKKYFDFVIGQEDAPQTKIEAVPETHTAKPHWKRKPQNVSVTAEKER